LRSPEHFLSELVRTHAHKDDMLKQVFSVVSKLIVALSLLAVSACAGANAVTMESTPQVTTPVAIPVTMYKEPECKCCSKHAAYLEENGFTVADTQEMYDDTMNQQFPVPEDQRSCHIDRVGDYFVEGHMPVRAIQELLNEKPDIAGIFLPGMPSGSPGMDGEQTEDFVVLALSDDGQVSEFLTVNMP
jgi:hypothetical protein